MWADTAAAGGPAPAVDDVKATQVNLVLHLGFGTSAEEAQAQFQVALRFSVRYPSRVVVLCPLAEGADETEFRAKIYGECFLGKAKGDTRCVEFVMLSYPLTARQYLENQVSVCLSTDLPLYYWAHHFTSLSRLKDYQYLLQQSKRVIIDSAHVPTSALTHDWPRPEAVRDLAQARLLPVRQSLGQFLSAFAPGLLVDGLRGFSVVHAPALGAEARVLVGWVKERLAACGASEKNLRAEQKAFPEGASGSFEIAFDYSNEQRFRWRGDLAKGEACIEAAYGCEKITMPSAISLLSPEVALAEAMFY